MIVPRPRIPFLLPSCGLRPHQNASEPLLELGVLLLYDLRKSDKANRLNANTINPRSLSASGISDVQTPFEVVVFLRMRYVGHDSIQTSPGFEGCSYIDRKSNDVFARPFKQTLANIKRANSTVNIERETRSNLTTPDNYVTTAWV